MSLNSSFWQGKKVFITGHTGFKGSWISLWLASMNAKIYGYSLEPPTNINFFEEAKIYEDMESYTGDIRNFELLKEKIRSFNPDILIHMAAQPLVRLSYKEPIDTYSTNVMGTVNVLEASKSAKNIRAIVNVTSDKCYDNKEWEWGYREDEPMGGFDPYSNSKGCAELVTSAYRTSFFLDSSINLASARSGNVIGGGDWAEDRLVPDALKAFENNKKLVIRNPLATRPWQHVLEPLSGYLKLAESLYEGKQKYSEGWNFGPNDSDNKNVEWIVGEISKQWGGNSNWEIDKSEQPHEANFLKLDISKAVKRLKWKPTWDIKKSISKTVKWHKLWLDKKNIKEESINQIKEFDS